MFHITPDPARTALLLRFWGQFVRPHAARLLLLAPSTLLTAGTAAGYAAVLKFAGDQIAQGDRALIYQVPAWIIGLTALRAAGMYAQTVLTSDLALRCLRDVQSAMFSALLDADFARVRREPSSGLVSRLVNDISLLSDGLVRSFGQLARDALTLPAALGVMLWIDWPLALLVVGVFALAASPLQRIARRARKQSRSVQSQMGDLAAALSESFDAAGPVRMFRLEGRERHRLATRFEARRKALLALVRNRAGADPLLELLGGAAAAGVFALIGWRVAAGGVTTGDILAFIGFLATASAAARGLGSYNTVLNESVAVLHRVYEVLDEPARIVEPERPVVLARPRGEIRFRDVCFHYPGATPGLKDISFCVEPGQTVALVGASGAGKSTLLHLIPRLYDVTAGSVLVDGVDVRGLSLASLRDAIAFVGQEAILFDDTIGANVGLGRVGAPVQDLHAALRAAAGDSLLADRPLGLDSPVGPRGGLLSGGERQRVALARAFLRDAPILLMDEPTSALDAASEHAIQQALTTLAAGRTTVIAAHRLSTVRRADCILVLDQGRIVERGDHASLSAAGGVYARLCRLQLFDGATPGAIPDRPAHSPSLG